MKFFQCLFGTKVLVLLLLRLGHQLFSAYQMIKDQESQGKSRREVMGKLVEKFGEKNPEVGTLPK